MTNLPHKSASGFTLLEVILATAMIAALSLTLYMCLSIGFRSRGAVQRQSEAAQQAAIVIDMIDRDLQSLHRLGGVLGDAFTGFSLSASTGEAHQMRYVALGSDRDRTTSPLGDGPRMIELRLTTDTTPPLLVRRVRRDLLSQNPREPEDEVLARNVTAFIVRYYDGESWYQDWDSTFLENALPLAIEVTLEFDLPTRQDPTKRYRIARLIPVPQGTDIANSTSTTGGAS
jgi:type II secretion system protein J